MYDLACFNSKYAAFFEFTDLTFVSEENRWIGYGRKSIRQKFTSCGPCIFWIFHIVLLEDVRSEILGCCFVLVAPFQQFQTRKYRISTIHSWLGHWIMALRYKVCFLSVCSAVLTGLRRKNPNYNEKCLVLPQSR